MSERARSRYRKVVVGVCHGAAAADTMRMAAEFAHLLGLDLHCLFVEDEALLALAELPFAREIQLPSHKWSRLDAGAIEAEIRQMALQARRLMDEIIRDVGVSAEFQVLRGDPATCIAAVCQTGDIVVVAENDAPTVPATHSLTRLHIGAHESATSILLLPARLKARHGAIVAMLTDTGDPALDMAGKLAALAKEDLVILLPEAAKRNTAQRAEASVKDRAQAMGLPSARINVRFVHDGGDDDALHALVGVRERLIVMARAASTPAAASHIAVARGVPLLLVEAEPHAAQETPRQSRRKPSTIADSGSPGSSTNS
jgi:type IV pilus biogenesis protein CpaD/CtpE